MSNVIGIPLSGTVIEDLITDAITIYEAMGTDVCAAWVLENVPKQLQTQVLSEINLYIKAKETNGQ